MTMEEKVAYLRRPFATVKFMVKGKSPVTNSDGNKVLLCLAYLDTALVVERLSDVDPFWSMEEPRPSLLDAKALVVPMTVLGATRFDVGTASQFEATKGAYSDAIKRAARLFGVGSYLRDDGWSFWLPEKVIDGAGKDHGAGWTVKDGKIAGITGPGKAYLRSVYDVQVAKPAIAKRYGTPIAYGDEAVEEVGDEGESEATAAAAAGGQVEVVRVLAGFDGRTNGVTAAANRLEGGTSFSKELNGLLLRVSNNLDLEPSDTDTLKELAVRAAENNDAATYAELRQWLAEHANKEG